MINKLYSLILSALLSCITFISFSATYYTRATGNWNTTTTWSLISCSGVSAGSIPGPADNVIICSGRTVTMNGAPGSCLSLTVNGTLNWTAALTTNVGTGGLTLNTGSTISGTTTGTLNIAGTMTVASGASVTIGNINLSVTGATNILGTATFNSTSGNKNFSTLNIIGGTLSSTSNETYNISGNLVMTNGAIDTPPPVNESFLIAGNFIVNGISSFDGGSITVTGTTTLNGTLNWISKKGTKTFGDIVIAAGGNFNSTVNENFRFTGNFQNNGSITAGGGSYSFLGSGTISGSGSTSISKVSVTGSYINQGNLTVTNSLSGTGTFSQGAAGIFTLTGTQTVNTFNASAAGNQVNYTMAGAYSIPIPGDGSYHHLSLSNGVKSLSAVTAVNGILTISPGCVLNANNQNMSIQQDFTNNGTFLATLATVTMNGTIAQAIGGTSATAFNNLTISNTSAVVSANTNLSAIGTITVNASAIFAPAAAVIVSGIGTLTGSGTIRVTRTATTPDLLSQYTILTKVLTGLNTDYIGAGNQNVNPLNYGSLTISSNGTRTVTFAAAVTGVANVFSPSSVTTSYVVTGNTLNFNGAVSQTIPAFNYYNLTSSSSGARILASSGSIGIANVFSTGSNAYSSTGSTVNYNGTASQNIVAFSYYNLSSSSSGSRTIAAAGIVSIAAVFTPGTNTYSVTGSTVNFNGTIAQAIPAFSYNNLTLSGSSAKTLGGNIVAFGNITITSNLDVSASNYSINVRRNWINNGTFNARQGTVTFAGTVAQTASGTATTSFENLALANSAGLSLTGGSYMLTGALTISSGTFNANSRPFEMVSTASKTARIAPITGAGSIAGSFTIQRFITARDTSYADLSSSVLASTLNDWDNELPAVSYLHNPPLSYASAYTYTEASDTYAALTSSGAALSPGRGIEVFLAGDYSYASLPATTMNTIGIPNQGTQNLSGLISNLSQGWNLVGNPFASSISWASVYAASGGAASGLYDYFEMYDHTAGSWSGYTSADGVEIGAAQGFWVYALPGASSLTLLIPESAKTSSSNSSIKAPLLEQPFFSLKMTSEANSFSHIFRVDARTDASDGFDALDLPYRPSPNKATPALYSSLSERKINRHVFNSGNESYSIPLTAKVSGPGRYSISASGFEFISEYSVVSLEDRLKNTWTDLSSQTVYEFEMNTREDEERFVLHFNKSNEAVTPSGPYAGTVDALQDASGVQLFFDYPAGSSVIISVLNVLGQEIVENMSVDVDRSTERKISLPGDFSGIYFVRIISEQGMIVKKFNH